MDELARNTADRLAQCRAVVRATREPGDSTKAATRLVLREGSRDANLLAMASRPGGKARLDSLVGRIARRIGIPLTGVVSGNELVVAVALDSLTVELVERLKQQAGIESAQPNYVVRAFGPRAP